MRKGADALSKWVGEAERQLRLLFDEAKACQPSIIFFDEIDGLAPVRSSKQDQIHASIVSTLLALMDGMDGRGQVIVIGATNRPDSIDPALRRPGRFDREFYFPLPNLPARQKILSILTKGWDGWETEGDQLRYMMAKATKGYGGADLRVCLFIRFSRSEGTDDSLGFDVGFMHGGGFECCAEEVSTNIQVQRKAALRSYYYQGPSQRFHDFRKKYVSYLFSHAMSH